jgi:hypothetical protein
VDLYRSSAAGACRLHLGWRRRRFSEGQAFQFFGGGKRLANRLSFVFFVD